MQAHVHTGFVSFLFAGLSAVVFIQLMRLAAAKAVQHDSTRAVGEMVASLVSFPERVG